MGTAPPRKPTSSLGNSLSCSIFFVSNLLLVVIGFLWKYSLKQCKIKNYFDAAKFTPTLRFPNKGLKPPGGLSRKPAELKTRGLIMYPQSISPVSGSQSEGRERKAWPVRISRCPERVQGVRWKLCEWFLPKFYRYFPGTFSPNRNFVRKLWPPSSGSHFADHSFVGTVFVHSFCHERDVCFTWFHCMQETRRLGNACQARRLWSSGENWLGFFWYMLQNTSKIRWKGQRGPQTLCMRVTSVST